MAREHQLQKQKSDAVHQGAHYQIESIVTTTFWTDKVSTHVLTDAQIAMYNAAIRLFGWMGAAMWYASSCLHVCGVSVKGLASIAGASWWFPKQLYGGILCAMVWPACVLVAVIFAESRT